MNLTHGGGGYTVAVCAKIAPEPERRLRAQVDYHWFYYLEADQLKKGSCKYVIPVFPAAT